jgi:hypothetical protein
MSTSSVNFNPPYLRYDVPTDLVKIQAEIVRIKKLSFPAIEVGSEHSKTKENNPKTTSTLLPPSNILVTPNGTIEMGFNCKKTFKVTNNLLSDYTTWELQFKNLSTGHFDIRMFMGVVEISANEINFEIDFSSYNDAAYRDNNGLATFRVFCQAYAWGMPSGFGTSNEVTLNFFAPSCIKIFSMVLNQDTFKGGSNGSEPVLTITLDAPAPPGGQKVLLRVSKPTIANIMGSGFFHVPAGKTSESLSWFLGTKNVSSNKSFNIIAKLQYADGVSTSTDAFANVNLKK